MSLKNERSSPCAGKLCCRESDMRYIDLYLPQRDGYLQIQMNLTDSGETNAYGWRLNMMYACDSELRQRFPVTNPGEYEAAIRLTNRPDFMGMGAHGSERMTTFCIYVDGKQVPPETLDVLTDFQQVQIRRESDFYDPADEVTRVAVHSVVYDFDLSGLTVTQEVNWLVEATCVRSYMMMFPVHRIYGGKQITDTFSDDLNPGEYDVSQAGFTGYPGQWTPGVTKMTLYSQKSGVTASMESLETPELAGGGYGHCWNAPAYNKLYFTVCGAEGAEQTVIPGDRWRTKHRYEVTIVRQ